MCASFLVIFVIEIVKFFHSLTLATIMKKIISTLLLLLTFISNAQNIFEYEKQINNPENYDFQEVGFQNQDENINLSGTLIMPKSNFDKIVIIVPGSGKDTRNSHYILAEQLLKNNIAVYRFDERGIGKSEGNYSELTKDLSNDINFAFKNLQKLNNDKKIGIIGHSVGGIATLKIIEENSKPNFIVLIETPILKNGAFVINQFKMDYENSLPEIMREGKTKNEIITFLEGYIQVIINSDTNSLKKEIKNYIKESGFNKRFITLLDDEFFIESIRTNLEDTLKNISIKCLYLTGTNDKIINHEDETRLIESFKNPKIEIEIFEGLNHYLTDRNGEIGSSLYNMDEQPLFLLTDWILKQ